MYELILKCICEIEQAKNQRVKEGDKKIKNVYIYIFINSNDSRRHSSSTLNTSSSRNSSNNKMMNDPWKLNFIFVKMHEQFKVQRQKTGNIFVSLFFFCCRRRWCCCCCCCCFCCCSCCSFNLILALRIGHKCNWTETYCRELCVYGTLC